MNGRRSSGDYGQNQLPRANQRHRPLTAGAGVARLALEIPMNRTRSAAALFLSLSLVASIGLSVTGCRIETHEACGGDDDDDDDHHGDHDCVTKVEAGPGGGAVSAAPAPAPTTSLVCDSFCDRLVVCGSIRASAEVSCRAKCQAGLATDPVATQQGCACVQQDACKPVSAYACPGAPLPADDVPPVAPGGGNAAGGTSGAGGASGTGASGGSAAGGAAAGGAAGVACTASCQCAAGQACVAGICATDTPPPPACATDCECLAGQHCSAGQCE